MKHQYDNKAKPRTFEVSDQVLVLLPTGGAKLGVRLEGPYSILRHRAVQLCY